ncbi:ATP-binding cassette sub-family G member 1-like [Coccinella septempunctata]|uniref:ATP-binding cassette sub-family G member 1-like n=1 Tax=Coccinella septempunctata TaxID=41139 RepID=UPI001D060CF3|nr:ATP-binding cassette sub-family G member 1-like [Coccinella septempunctata]
MEDSVQVMANKNLTYFPTRPPVNIEFQDLSYAVPQGRKGTKLILRNVNGQFYSGQLTAILGPSGAGKSTLLNILAGYKCTGATGTVLINGEDRNLKKFRRLSRYIMQQDLVQPWLTVQEAMVVAANLKLNKEMSPQDKLLAIDDVLELLRLSSAKNTSTDRLSGGERKRLAIALELLNNPPVIFLDEPTTGLDDLSCSQCIALLKLLAKGGRTVICSIHTPSARLFNSFDNVYCVNNGQCVYHGYGPSVIPFLSNIGLDCPTTYNPADFLIEVCCGEYGDFQDKMVSCIENGHNCYDNKKPVKNVEQMIEEPVNENVKRQCSIYSDNNPVKRSATQQFVVLLLRMWLQMWRDKGGLALRVAVHTLLGLLVGSIYIGMGQDGSKTIFNFGFYFNCIIFFMYVPMMPVLLQFPTEVQLLKREHFNRWYGLGSYFMALTCSTIPLQLILGFLYLGLVYIISDQPMELYRWSMFYFICMLTAIISESLGLLIATNLNIVNAMFVGPVATVPLMLLAVYGFGSGAENIPFIIRVSMYFSYLRYSMEGLIDAMLRDRPNLPCPDDEEFCIFTDLNYFIRVMGMENTIFWVDIVALVFCILLFRGVGYYLLRQRLSPNKTFLAIQYIGRFVKSHFSIAR